MALKLIVSYDDTDYDHDALALGRLLALGGAELSLAYVVHSFGGALEEKEAEEMLARGAASVGAPEMPRHVVVNPGTSVGLTELAEREDADVIVFGSEYRTAPGHGQAGHLRPTNCCSADRRRSPSRRPVCATTPVGERQHGRRHRRGRPGGPGRPRRASPPRSARSVAEHGVRSASTCSSSAPGPRPRRARSSSAPKATTRSRPRPTRCWSFPAAPRSTSGPAGPAAPLVLRPDDEDHGRDLRVAAVDPARARRPSGSRRPSWPADDLGGDRLRRLGFDHEGVRRRRRRRR